IRLDAVCFSIETGFPRDAPARFFKHGYQSWSSSGAVAVGQRDHRRDSMNSIIRLSHQSERARPPEAPEGATSELFTIIECSGESVLAGFLDGASAFSTLTVLSPEAIVARILLDGIELAPKAVLELAPLYLQRSRESASILAANWAGRIGEAMRARVGARYQGGWCSWYHYFHAITEEALLASLDALAARRVEFPIEIFQLDDGYQSALGDWESTNSKFPSGLKSLAARIRDAGFEPGIWTAPFLAGRDSRLMREHPEWFLRHDNDQPLRAGYNPNWSEVDDKFAYALDASNPAFRDHLTSLFGRFTRDFGYSYLKLDFLFATSAEGVRHNPNMTRARALRAGLEAIRAGAGDSAFILGCGCPLGPAIGIVDGMRIGPDVAPSWGAGGSDPSTVHALDAIAVRSFMHRQLCLNDPDCLMLRSRETELTDEEREALATVIAASGGMLLISDDMALLGNEEAKLFRAAAELGARIDTNSVH